MNSKVFVFLIFLLFIVVGGITAVYLLYEQPKQAQISQNYVNLSISSLDEKGNFIKTGFIVYVNNSLYSSGNTTELGYTLNQIPQNEEIVVYNQNLENQTYYTYIYHKGIYDSLPSRIELQLQKPSDLNITSDKILGQGDSKINLNISSKGIFKDAIMCIKWSVHILTINTGFILIDTPKELSSYDKCYDLNRTIVNSTMPVSIFFSSFGDLYNDFIYVRLADREMTYV